MRNEQKIATGFYPRVELNEIATAFYKSLAMTEFSLSKASAMTGEIALHYRKGDSRVATLLAMTVWGGCDIACRRNDGAGAVAQ